MIKIERKITEKSKKAAASLQMAKKIMLLTIRQK